MPTKVFNIKLGYALFLLLSFINSYSQSTNADSASTEKHIYSDKVTGGPGSMFSYKTEKQKKLVIRDNLTFTTYGFQMSPIENEILDLEVLECRALLNRDTSILKSVWARDFTLDDSSTKILINGKNPLPYYGSLKRVVENFTARDNFVYTSGYEFFQQLKLVGQ